MSMTAAPVISTKAGDRSDDPHPRRLIRLVGPALFLSVSLLFVPDVPQASEASRGSAETDWLAASSAFKLELHALAAEALILQLRNPSRDELSDPAADPRLLLRAGERLSDSLRAANAFLSMMEIAGYSDRGKRVREVLLLWLDSSRRSLADHLEGSASSFVGSSPGPQTAAFLEELRIIWRRLDGAYADLEAVLRTA